LSDHCQRYKGGEDVAYDHKGKGSTVHLLTEGNGLALAFLVTAANVAEVTVGLKVVDRVRVPRPQGRPKQRPDSLGADKSYDSAEFRQGVAATADSAFGAPADMAQPEAQTWPPSRDSRSQQVSLEGGAEPRLAGQLAPAGHPV
jgi:hypothetical protein